MRTQVGSLELLSMSGYDYRADLKETHTAIVHARDEGELSLAVAQLKVCFVAPPKKAIPA